MLQRINDHIERAIQLLPRQFRQHPGASVVALITPSIGELQVLEDEADVMQTIYVLEEQSGGRIDWIGRMLAVSRRSLSDSAYRARIRTELAALRSNATFFEVIGLLRLLSGADMERTFIDSYQVAYAFLGADAGVDLADIRARLLEVIGPAVTLYDLLSVSDSWFAWAGDNATGAGGWDDGRWTEVF